MDAAKPLAYLGRTAAKLLSRSRPETAARLFALTHRLNPGNERYTRRAVDALLKTGAVAEAARICDMQLRQADELGYWRHLASYIAELGEDRFEPRGQPRIALLNDTDRRPNIGCRLTSQSFKSAILAAFPEATIHPAGFRFRSYRSGPGDLASVAKTDIGRAVERLVEMGYGKTGLAAIRSADFVVLQPEGSLSDDVGLLGFVIFFSPILQALLTGKPCAVMNGTIPAIHDARGRFVHQLLALVGHVVARDKISADAYRVPFLPDAALLHETAGQETARDACLITTGARNSREQDQAIVAGALEVCDAFGLRPIVLTRASERFSDFRDAIAARDGVFAETAGLTMAEQTLAACRLHIGARYHMAIFSLLCGVPSVLFDVRTRKNEWLADFSSMIHLARPGDPLVEAASAMLERTGTCPPTREGLRADYVAALHKARAETPRDCSAELQALVDWALTTRA